MINAALFGHELREAGLHEGVSFSEDGDLTFRDDVSAQARAAVEALRDAHDPEAAPDPIIIVYPADLWRRTTDEEAEAIDAAVQEQPLRLRRLFEMAQTFQSDDELWPLLMGAATDLFGEARALELLAPSD